MTQKFSFKKATAPAVASQAAPAATAEAPASQNPAPAPAAKQPDPQIATPAPVEVVAELPAKTTPVNAPAPTAPAVAPAASAPAIAGTNLPAVQAANNAVTEHRAPASYGDDSDNVGVSDIKLPRLNIVQKVGDLSNVFTEGDILLNQETVIRKSNKTDKDGKPLRIVVCGFRADRYAEKTTGGARGDIVDTVQEVYGKGATTDYNEAKATGKKLYQQLAECIILIEKPEGINDPSFSYYADGKQYAVAVWAQKGTAFTNGAKIIRTARKIGWLKDDLNPDNSIKVKRGYGHGLWELRADLEQYGSNFAWKPVLKRAEYSGPELIQLAERVVG